MNGRAEGGVAPANVVLTFDCEVFFAGGTTLRSCVIDPMDRILKVLQPTGARACFFMDGPMVACLAHEPSAVREYDDLCGLLARLVSAGHRIELHAHPQWLTARHDGDRWTFPADSAYSLADIEPVGVVDLIATGAEALSEAVRGASPGYAVQAFRAPGLWAQPFAPIAAGMARAGLSIDSSVSPGTYREMGDHVCDYRGAPPAVSWRFEDDPLVPSAAGRFAELPVTCVRKSLTRRVSNVIARRVDQGAYVRFGEGCWQARPDRMFDRIRSVPTVLTLEATSPGALAEALAMAGPVAVVLSHPKSMSEVSLRSLEWLADSGASFVLPAEVISPSSHTRADAVSHVARAD